MRSQREDLPLNCELIEICFAQVQVFLRLPADPPYLHSPPKKLVIVLFFLSRVLGTSRDFESMMNLFLRPALSPCRHHNYRECRYFSLPSPLSLNSIYQSIHKLSGFLSPPAFPPLLRLFPPSLLVPFGSGTKTRIRRRTRMWRRRRARE